MFAPCNVCAYEHVVENRLENDREILSAAGQCLRDGDTAAVFYVTGRNYVPEGTVQALSGTVFYCSVSSVSRRPSLCFVPSGSTI